ncbi:AAA family ATPase [Acinetobacter bereziniae]|uniref:AAA family ATPase n=1 Tax=Acinetobacter bereziniae TaxID=106648 RepID=UPI0028143866|nr:AAA family ATPase [Acinetobacter bereziniae]MDQ9820889.1 AAA family ATPase [Acinetobacter bereziniae]
MLSKIRIFNYKSLNNIYFDPTHVNLFLGENGAGKSNILEALTMYSAAKSNMLGNEFLISRGIRPIDPLTTLCQLPLLNIKDNEKSKNFAIFTEDNLLPIGVAICHDEEDPYRGLKANIFAARFEEDEGGEKSYLIDEDIEKSHSQMMNDLFKNFSELNKIAPEVKNIQDIYKEEFIHKFKNKNKIAKLQELQHKIHFLGEGLKLIEGFREKKSSKDNFVIYNPEINTLMGDNIQSQIQPLGINGEGLFTLLKVMAQKEPENFKDVIDTASIFNWLEKIELTDDPIDQKIILKDRFMNSYISPKSANEGFLFSLFYACLFCSGQTPSVFAIESIDKSLNPRLCQELIKKLIEKAKKYKKQVFLTSHNAAVLDGMDLLDKDQSIFIIERGSAGETKIRKLTEEHIPKPKRNGEKLNLSEAFLRGMLGGLPSKF